MEKNINLLDGEEPVSIFILSCEVIWVTVCFQVNDCLHFFFCLFRVQKFLEYHLQLVTKSRICKYNDCIDRFLSFCQELLLYSVVNDIFFPL